MNDNYERFLTSCKDVLARSATPQQPLTIFGLTASGQGAPWFCTDDDWCEARVAAHAAEDDPHCKWRFTKRLFNRVEDFDRRLLDDMVKEKFREKSLSVAAFSDEVFPSGAGRDWLHGLMSAQALDRVLWVTSNERATPDERPSQRRHHAVPSETALSKKMKKLRNAYTNWAETMDEMRRAWTTNFRADELERIRSQASSRSFESDEEHDREVFSSLYAGAVRSQAGSHIYTAEANFCMCALAMRALAQVSLTLFFIFFFC